MAANDNKRYYWLKLEEDFFKRHDITIIESMANGKDYILFYLKLLCESTSHEGYLRFSKTIPYSAEMLSTITRTNIDVVKSAVKVFTELNMMQIMDDGTLYFEQVQKMIGSETGQTIRKREAKEAKNLIEGKAEVKNTLDIDKEIDIDEELDKEIEDRNGYKQIEAKHSFARTLLAPLFDIGYINEAEFVVDGYESFIKDCLDKTSLTDLKIKIAYFASSISKPVVSSEKTVSYTYDAAYHPVDNKFLYFAKSIERALNASKKDGCL